MNDKFLSYQRYPKQILGDDKVLAMDWDVRGMHNWLLDISWQQDPRGTIPADHAVLRRWLGSPSDDNWRRIWPQLSPAWPIQAGGRLGNLGMIRTAERKLNYSNGNANKGANRSQTGSQISRKPSEKDKEKVLEVLKEEKSANLGKVCPEFDGEKWIERIIDAHPKPVRGYGYQTLILGKIEKEAERFGGDLEKGADFILRQTQAYAETVGTSQYAFNSAKFFGDEIYAWKPDAWPKEKIDERELKNNREANVGVWRPK